MRWVSRSSGRGGSEEDFSHDRCRKEAVAGASVAAKVVKNGKAKKITVFTYKPKKNSKRKMGHRQPYTKVEISAINA